MNNIVQQVSHLLQGVNQDLSQLVNQLLNPQLPWAQKQPLIQQIVNSLPQNLQVGLQYRDLKKKRKKWAENGKNDKNTPGVR